MFIYPSLMGADQLRLAEVITKLEPYCAGFHLDSMDGHLVPNISGGVLWTNAIGRFTKKPVWVHLMVTDPASWIPHLQLPSDSMIDFQYDISINHMHVLDLIRARGYKAGLSIAPKTTIQSVISYISVYDYISIMAVEPGFSGQSFIPETIEKIRTLSTYKQQNNHSFFIACDGGITELLLPVLESHKVTHVAIASTLFTVEDPLALLKRYYCQK